MKSSASSQRLCTPRSWNASVPDFLVTGTDTGIGKTVVAAALVKVSATEGGAAVCRLTP